MAERIKAGDLAIRATDLDRCPRCGGPTFRRPAGISSHGQTYEEFWRCDAKIPCTEVLSWKTTRQWAYLREQIKRR